MHDIICGICGFETNAATREEADTEHEFYDRQHRAFWREDGIALTLEDW